MLQEEDITIVELLRAFELFVSEAQLNLSWLMFKTSPYYLSSGPFFVYCFNGSNFEIFSSCILFFLLLSKVFKFFKPQKAESYLCFFILSSVVQHTVIYCLYMFLLPFCMISIYQTFWPLSPSPSINWYNRVNGSL